MAQETGMDIDSTNTNGNEKVKYEISKQLTMHKAPVRCILTVGNDRIISGDRKGNFVDWTRKLINFDIEDSDTKMDGSNEKELINDFEGRLIFDTGLHDLTFCIIKGNEYLSNDGSKFDTYISTGDHIAAQWTLDGFILRQYIGHSNSVISIDTLCNENEIITGSFDSTAKIWNLDKTDTIDTNGMAKHINETKTLLGHTHGVEVCGLETGEIVTGTFKQIFIWDKNGNKIKTIENAHSHMIRKVIKHPLGFLTCANDGFVKLWSNKGDLLNSILAHPENANTPSFVYGLKCDKNGNIFSCGEDGTAKMFDENGNLICILRHPGVVWSIDLFENEDIVTACGDGCVRIWSKDKERIASEEKVYEYYNGLTLAMQAQGAPVSDSQLEPMSVLETPGKPGAFKMVNDPQKGPSVYQYDATKGEWTYIGQIMGNKENNNNNNNNNNNINGGKGTINGKEYDHVVYIDLNDRDGKFPLGFNIDDDPRQISRDFCVINGIDLDLAPQIESHLKPYANAEARAKRLQKEAKEAAKIMKHIPSYKVCQSEINGKGNINGIKKKILEFNNDDSIVKLNLSITNEEDVKILDHLFSILSDQSNWHVTEFPDLAVALIAKKLIEWPTDKILPVLDIIRMLMLHQNAILKLLGFNEENGSNFGKKIRKTILEHINGRDSEFTPNMQLITCRLISNFLAKRSRSEEERKGKCPLDLIEYLEEVVSGLAPAAESNKNAIFTAYLMMVHNAMLWFSKFKIEENNLYLLIASALFTMFETSLKDPNTNKVNEKVLYYGLSVIGTIAWSSKSAKNEIIEAFQDNLKSVCKEAINHVNNQACKEIGNEIKTLFDLQL